MEDLTQIRGVGPATAAALCEAGLTDVGAVAGADLDVLVLVPGIAAARAEALRSAARAMAAHSQTTRVGSEQRHGEVATPLASQSAAEESAGRRQRKKSRKRRRAARAKIDIQLESLKERLAEVEASVDRARGKVEKANSKTKRNKRRKELDEFRRRAKKLGKRIEALRRRRSDLGG